MIKPLNNDLYAKVFALLRKLIPTRHISPEFDAYLTDTAIAIRYSGIIPALLNNDGKAGIGSSGLDPSLVNCILIKLLREAFHYPDYLQYGTIKDICQNPKTGGMLKSQMLEILGCLRFAVKTYQQYKNYSYDNEYSTSLRTECNLGSQNFRQDTNPDRRNGENANLRLAFYSYFETNIGYQSWFDSYGTDKVNRNIETNLASYQNKFRVDDTVMNKLPKPKGSAFRSFNLQVGSRGLLVGTGYPHMNILNDKDRSDYQLGFYFDHTTGIPIIPASSIKGFLRSAFPGEIHDDYVLERLKTAITSAGVNLPETFSFTEAKFIKEKIFGTDEKSATNNVFFNAYISGRQNPTYDQAADNLEYYVDEDWLAPHLHKEKRSRFREPKPIRFLKIVPGVEFAFGFLVDDTIVNDSFKITADQKIELFKHLLTSRNFGAKHRTGFGSFIDTSQRGARN
jgi:CRISPR-associated protein Cmr6